MNRYVLRFRQGLFALRPRIPIDRDEILERTVNPALAAAFRRLPPFDQAHLCGVYRALVRLGVIDAELLAAGLLHDLGKIDEVGHTVRLPHRAARVVFRVIFPGLLTWLATPPPAGWRAGFVLAVHHPAMGAERAQRLGASERTVWLIAHHEDAPAHDDGGLRLLHEADRRAIDLM